MQLDTSRLWSLFILVVSQFVYEATFSLLLSGSHVRAHALRTGHLSSKPVTACSTTLGKVVTSHRVQNVLLKGDMQTASNHSGSVYDYFFLTFTVAQKQYTVETILCVLNLDLFPG